MVKKTSGWPSVCLLNRESNQRDTTTLFFFRFAGRRLKIGDFFDLNQMPKTLMKKDWLSTNQKWDQSKSAQAVEETTWLQVFTFIDYHTFEWSSPFWQFWIQHLPVHVALGSGRLHLTRHKCPVIQSLQGRKVWPFFCFRKCSVNLQTLRSFHSAPGCRIVCCTDETSVYDKSAGVLTIGITIKKTTKQTWTKIY